MVSTEALGGIGAVIKVMGAISNVTFLFGLFGALAVALAAWLQTRQHQVLANTYSMTANELTSIRALALWQETEASWVTFVGDVEGAISREHALWCSFCRVRAAMPVPR